MNQQQSHQEENQEMIEMNIKEFMAMAHYYLFGMPLLKQPVLATIPAQQGNRC
jgi:hypothetical protein